MNNKIRLGRVNTEIKSSQSYNPKIDHISILGEYLSIEKHKWSCDWYWGFGYIVNRNLHTHSSLFIKELLWSSNKDVFLNSIFKTDQQFWVFKDLLKQAYALQSASEVYKHGGCCITIKGITDVIKNQQRARWINIDLKKVLNTLWDYLTELSNSTE